MATFPGFPAETFTFLSELKQNNNRNWFNENKTRYQQDVVAPIVSFIDAIREPLHEISPRFVADSRPHRGSMFRIYRDARFSKDKRPYKENVGCQFRHEAGKDAHAPGFYLHIEPGNVFFGGGIWQPPNPVLAKIRFMMHAFPKSWQKVLDDEGLQHAFEGIQGDSLQRPPRGYDADHPFIDDLKRKSFFVMQSIDDRSSMQKTFINKVVNCYQAASPLMEFLTRSVELPYR